MNQRRAGLESNHLLRLQKWSDLRNQEMASAEGIADLNLECSQAIAILKNRRQPI